MANDTEVRMNFNMSDGTTQQQVFRVPGGQDGQSGGGDGEKVQNTAARGEVMRLYLKGTLGQPEPGTAANLQAPMIDSQPQLQFLTLAAPAVVKVPYNGNTGAIGNTFEVVYTDGNVEGNQKVGLTQLVLTDAKARFLLNAMNSDVIFLRAKPFVYSVRQDNSIEGKSAVLGVGYSKGGGDDYSRLYNDFTLVIRRLANDSLTFSGTLFPFSDKGTTDVYTDEEVTDSSALSHYVGIDVIVENNVTNIQNNL